VICGTVWYCFGDCWPLSDVWEILEVLPWEWRRCTTIHSLLSHVPELALLFDSLVAVVGLYVLWFDGRCVSVVGWLVCVI
jgi:hypothetical protein